MKILALIPGRMGSSRFPGKPMALINGTPMIGHVYMNVCKNKKLDQVAVATCDKVIFDYINSIGGLAIMTSKKHDRATDRCAEALKKIEKINKSNFDIIVMIQGDEPMVTSDMINRSLKPFKKNKQTGVVNLLGKFEDKKEFNNPNSIKVICDKDDNAIYFTRNLPDKIFHSKNVNFGKQICIIPFRRNILIKYLKLKPTSLEIHESVDMWRFLENGFKVKMVKMKGYSFAVDSKEDLKKVSLLIKK